MQNQFIYFVCVKGNKDILKAEVNFRFSYLTPSFSKGDFLTYKNTGKLLSKNDIKMMSPAFALDWGESIGKINDVYDSVIQCQNSKIILPEESPSRAYLKIAEVCDFLEIQKDSNLNWIEFGSAPGGAIYYLLQNFGEICGVDPGAMEKICLDNSRYIHLEKPIQNLSQEELPDHPIHYIASDLNINPKQGIKEVIRLSKKYRTVKGIFYTFKLVKLEHIKILNDYKKQFQELGYKKTFFKQLPSHKRETVLIALR